MALLSFSFQYLIPLILFGGVVPYTHDGISAGLTTMGYVAVGVLCFIIIRKLKESVLNQDKSLLRGLLLAVFRIVPYVLIGLAGSWLCGFISRLVAFWWDMLIFVALSCAFTIIEEALYEKKVKEDVKT